MKAFVILPAAVAAILTLQISAASSQAACSKEYQGCMDYCAARPTQATQGSCINSCEVKNNSCAEGIYGRRPVNATPAIAAAPQAKAKEALAKEPAQDAPQQQQQQQEQQAPQQEQQQQAPQKAKAPAPARR
jgi:hypothetical protein